MARVFVNASTLGSGGGRTYLLNLLRSSAGRGRGHEVRVLLPSDELSVFEGLASECMVLLRAPRRKGLRGWRRLLWSQLMLPLMVQRSHPDVLVSVGGVDVFAASALFNVPSIVTVQNSAPWMVPNLLQSRARAAYLRLSMRLSSVTADRLIAMSETARREMCEAFGIDLNRVSVASPGGASEQFVPKSAGRLSALAAYGIQKPYLLSVSSIFAYKNYHRLIQAYAMLRSRWSAAPPLVIVGEVKDQSYYASLVRQTASLGLNSSVQFVGRVAYEDLPAVYANSEAYVFPSLCESFGLTSLEAMACGVPVAASRLSAIPEICADAALYFDPFFPEEIAAALVSVLTEESVRQDLVSRGHLRARDFSWERNANETWAIIEGVCGP